MVSSPFQRISNSPTLPHKDYLELDFFNQSHYLEFDFLNQSHYLEIDFFNQSHFFWNLILHDMFLAQTFAYTRKASLRT